MLHNKYSYKYENPYNGIFKITQCWNNSTVVFKIGATEIIYNICSIKPL